MSTYDDDDIQFDFFDEPETVEATQRRRLPRLERSGRGGGEEKPPRPPRQPPTIHTHLLDAIERRAKGLAGIGDTLAQAASKKGANDTVTALALQGNLLAASDVVWEQLYRQPAIAELKRQAVTGVAIPP